MNIIDHVRELLHLRHQSRSSAQTAKERLQIVLAHERVSRDGDDFLPRLQREIIAVVARYVEIDPEKATVRLDKGSDMSTLEIEIELPGRAKAALQ